MRKWINIAEAVILVAMLVFVMLSPIKIEYDSIIDIINFNSMKDFGNEVFKWDYRLSTVDFKPVSEKITSKKVLEKIDFLKYEYTNSDVKSQKNTIVKFSDYNDLLLHTFIFQGSTEPINNWWPHSKIAKAYIGNRVVNLIKHDYLVICQPVENREDLPKDYCYFIENNTANRFLMFQASNAGTEIIKFDKFNEDGSTETVEITVNVVEER